MAPNEITDLELQELVLERFQINLAKLCYHRRLLARIERLEKQYGRGLRPSWVSADLAIDQQRAAAAYREAFSEEKTK